jgi:hypothetical protein
VKVVKRIEDIKEFEDIDTYYGILDIVSEVFQDRIEVHKHLVTSNKEILILNNRISALEHQLQQKENIIKEVREYITSYESIETIQQFDHNKNNKDLDYSTINEMTRRYMIVHDKVLEILSKVD